MIRFSYKEMALCFSHKQQKFYKRKTKHYWNNVCPTELLQKVGVKSIDRTAITR